MAVRSSLLCGLVAVAMIAPVPALARNSTYAEKGLGDAVAKLNDPQLQQSVAGMIAMFSEALMGMKAAPFMKAMDTMESSAAKAAGEADGDDRKTGRKIDPDATLGDLMGPEARSLPQDMANKVPAMMGVMAGMAGSMQGMLPELEAMGKRLKQQMPRK